MSSDKIKARINELAQEHDNIVRQMEQYKQEFNRMNERRTQIVGAISELQAMLKDIESEVSVKEAPSDVEDQTAP